MRKHPLIYQAIVIISLFFPIDSYPQQLPIKPTRAISFTTDEGSYMDVDISPDGQTLVFDLLGDLYTLPVAGGQARQLTHGMAIHVQPRWSPDGKSIAYTSDVSGEVHLAIMDAAATFQKVLGPTDRPPFDLDLDALWTPDGHYLSVSDSLYSIEGGKLPSKLPTRHPIGFSPDGKLVYGLQRDTVCSYDLTTKTRNVLADLPRNSRGFTMSKDARWVCYLVDTNNRRSLIALDLSTNSSRIIVSSLNKYKMAPTFWTPAQHFSISADSRTLFIGYGGKIHRIDLSSGEDRIIPFTAHARIDMGPYVYNTFTIPRASTKLKYIRNANISPDGKHLVFGALDRVYIMDLPNGSPRVLAPQSINQFQPVWSPDGNWIAYVSWCDTSGGALWRVPAAGGRPEQLTHFPGYYEHPAWSPDGTTLAVIRGAAKSSNRDRDDPGIGTLELIPINGNPTKSIDDSVLLWNNVVFSSDGKSIIYTPKYRTPNHLGQSPQLVSRDTDGKNAQILALGTQPTAFSQKSISPDGRYIVYSIDEDLYLVPICQLTNPMVMFNWYSQPSAIRFAAGVDPYWDQNGKMLSWTYGNKCYRINPDKIMAAAERIPSNEKGIDEFISLTIPPDQTIPLDLFVPTGYGRGLLALKNVRIITMHDSDVIRQGTIIIQNGRIIALGPTDHVQIPKTARQIDLAGKTVIPGFVDLHLHLRLSADIFPQESWKLLINLAYGTTTARDPSLNFESFGVAELLTSGQTLGPRLYTVGRPVRMGDGVLRMAGLNDAQTVVNKRALFGGVIIKQYVLPNRIQREWLLQATSEARLNMTNEGSTDPFDELAMIKDGSTGVEHNPFWDGDSKDLITFFAKSRVYFTPTLQVSYGFDIYGGQNYFDHTYWTTPDAKLAHFTPLDVLKKIQNHPADTSRPDFLYQSEADARILHQGGRIGMGSHGNDQGIGAHNELWALQAGGMSNMEALRCATLTGAEALGLQKDLGSLEIGKIADLIVLDKNPLDDIHNSREIHYVMKDGILYDGDTLDEIWPEQKKCPDWKIHETHN